MKKTTISILVIVVIAVISLINNKAVRNSITGGAVFDLTGEYPGIGLFIAVIITALGLFLVVKHHNR